ncbi:hypothetical protein BC832DRAFT_546534 [Gaertneriomyces semiglobifer]|nr:hypothetical protein BC832DRAFT_546534 [Gaertneriomyces semiglobifer]
MHKSHINRPHHTFNGTKEKQKDVGQEIATTFTNHPKERVVKTPVWHPFLGLYGSGYT